MPVRTELKYNITLPMIGSIPAFHCDRTGIATKRRMPQVNVKVAVFLDVAKTLYVIGGAENQSWVYFGPAVVGRFG
jgi:hypothetical protein